MKQSKLLFFLSVLYMCTFVHTNDIILKDLKLFVNCEEFIIKAMCYHPVPNGWKNIASDLTGGGGLCSVKMTPFGEWKSACYDSDFYDGSLDVPERYPPGPPNGWFRGLWERDFPIMKELGTNTLRLYTTNPTTKKASEEQVGTNGILLPLGKDHIPFMDMCSEYGFKVIFPLIGDFTILNTRTEDEVKQFLRNQIDEVGNHDALLMWNFSNELPLDTNPDIVQLLNKYMRYIREYTMQKWNRFVPVTAAVVDIPTSYDTLMETLEVDVFSTNAGYRGLDFQDLWSGDRTLGFSGFANLTIKHNKPVFIAEIGWHQENDEITYQIPDWFNQIYKDLIVHMDQGTIGGAFFEYSDEPYSKTDILQQTMGVVHFNNSIDPSTGADSTQPDVWTPDTVFKKPFIFDAVKSGTFEGKPYNFNADVWELMGRTKIVLSEAECAATAPVTSTTGVRGSTGKTDSQSGSTTGVRGSTSTSGVQPTQQSPTGIADMEEDSSADKLIGSTIFAVLFVGLLLKNL